MRIFRKFVEDAENMMSFDSIEHFKRMIEYYEKQLSDLSITKEQRERYEKMKKEATKNKLGMMNYEKKIRRKLNAYHKIATVMDSIFS